MSELDNVKSAGSETLTTPGLSEFKRLLEQSLREHNEISGELTAARAREQVDVAKYSSWKEGWFLRRVFKQKLQKLAVDAEEASARRVELEEQENLSRLRTQIDLPQSVAKAFDRARDEFLQLSKSARIWDTVGQRTTNRTLERTTASRVVAREPVTFSLAKCEIIESEWSVPHLANANGGDIFLYPGFVLCFVSHEAFALLEYKDVELDYSQTRFIEEEYLPPDAKVVGETWTRTNNDGTPDRRFKENSRIPIVQYGKLTLKSATGMNEEYMMSNADRSEAFVKAWKDLVSAVSAEEQPVDRAAGAGLPSDETSLPVRKIGELIASGEFSRASFDKLMESEGLSNASNLKETFLDVTLDFIRKCVEDHKLSPIEIAELDALVGFFQIEEGDFFELRRDAVQQVIGAQATWILEDRYVTELEEVLQRDLQRLFGLSYDQYVALLRPLAETHIEELEGKRQTSQDRDELALIDSSIRNLRGVFLIAGQR